MSTSFYGGADKRKAQLEPGPGVQGKIAKIMQTEGDPSRAGYVSAPVPGVTPGGFQALARMAGEKLGLPVAGSDPAQAARLAALTRDMNPYLMVGDTAFPSTRIASVGPFRLYDDESAKVEDIYNAKSSQQVPIQVGLDHTGHVDYKHMTRSIGQVQPLFQRVHDPYARTPASSYETNLAGLYKWNEWAHPSNARMNGRTQPDLINGRLNPALTGRDFDADDYVVEASLLLDFYRLCGVLLWAGLPPDPGMTSVRASATIHTRGLFNNLANIWATSTDSQITTGDHLWLVIRKRTLGYEAFENKYDGNNWQTVRERIHAERLRRCSDHTALPEFQEYWRMEPVATHNRQPPPRDSYVIPSFKNRRETKTQPDFVWEGHCIHFGIVQMTNGIDVASRSRVDNLIKSSIYFEQNVLDPMTDAQRAKNMEKVPTIDVHISVSLPRE